jgi:hypothetical protein
MSIRPQKVQRSIDTCYQALSEDSVVGPRASVFSPDKDGEAGDIGCIVDGAPDVHRDSQAENKPLEARSSFLTEPISGI